MSETVQPDNIFAYIIGALKSGTPIEVIRAEVDGAARLLELLTFTCPECGRTSHNKNDVHEKYCGACHKFFDSEGRSIDADIEGEQGKVSEGLASDQRSRPV